MIKKIFLIACMSGIFLPVLGQYEEQALTVLDQMSENYKNLDSFKADFSYSLENKMEDIQEEFSGDIIVKGDKFKLNLGDQVIFNDGEIMWTEVTRSMRQRWGLGENSDSGLANFLSGVRGSKVVIVFTERDDGIIDVGMRSVPGYDVATVALKLGGGGHPQAAGCTLGGDMPAVQARVLEEVKQSLAATRLEEP